MEHHFGKTKTHDIIWGEGEIFLGGTILVLNIIGVASWRETPKDLQHPDTSK